MASACTEGDVGLQERAYAELGCQFAIAHRAQASRMQEASSSGSRHGAVRVAGRVLPELRCKRRFAGLHTLER